MKTIIRIAEHHHKALAAHLLVDDCEAVAIALCGHHLSENGAFLSIREIYPIPYEDCPIRTPDRVTWKTQAALPAIEKAARDGLSLLKIHSHPGGYAAFSSIDDFSDGEFFDSLLGWVDGCQPHCSLIFLPDKSFIGRRFHENGQFTPVDRILVAGEDVSIRDADREYENLPEFTRRHAQLFGAGTIQKLRNLKVGVVGCSGTGGPVIEQLARLGVGEMVLVDPDTVEEKNLNRIPNATMEDAQLNRPKVEVAQRAITAMGLGTNVQAFQKNLFDTDAMAAIIECDFLFGCMDSVDGRNLLNRISTFYVIPYLDLGVRLIADEQGGVTQVCGSVHYLKPGGSTLLSRSVYTSEELQSADLYRTDPERYQDLKQKAYIKGVQEDRPAVISLNTFTASLGVMEFLARLHPYRDDDNSEFGVAGVKSQTATFSLTQFQFYRLPEQEGQNGLTRFVGFGDCEPFLMMPGLRS